MNDQIFWVLELAIKPGQHDAFETLMNEMVDRTQANEPHTLNYEWYLSGDKTECHIHERYENADALLIHMAGFGEHFAERFFSAVDPKRMVVYGPVTDEVREVLDPVGAVYMQPWGGFAR